MPELEEPESTVETPPVTAVAAEPAPPAVAAAPPDEPEGTIEVQGQKLVPLAALQATRRGEKEAKEQLTQMRQAAASLQPYLVYLQQHPELLQGGVPADGQGGTEPEDDGTADVARMFDLYTPQGQPDLDRARKIGAFVQQHAQVIADQAVQPLTQQNTQEQSGRNYQRALATPDARGRKPDPQVLRVMWENLPAEYTADERVAAVLAYTAHGYGSVHQTPQPPPPANPPLVTDSPGSRQGARVALSELEQNIATLRGVKPAEWQAYTASFRPGQPNVVEE